MAISCLLLGMPSSEDSAWNGEAASTSQSEPEFTIYLNLTDNGGWSSYWPLWPRENAELIVRSDGYASLRDYLGCMNATISTSLARQVYEAMCDEEMLLLNARIEDPVWNELNPPSEESELTLVTTDFQKSVVFEGNSIAGVMPCSTALLGNIIWAVRTGHADLLDVSIGVSSVPVDSYLSEIRVNITNNNEFTIYHSASAQPGNFVIVSSDGGSSPDSGLDVGITTWWSVPIEPGETLDLWFDDLGSLWNTSSVPPGTYTVMVRVAVDDNPESSNECMYNYIILEVEGQDEGTPSTEALISGIPLYALTGTIIVAAVAAVVLYRKKKGSKKNQIQPEVSEPRGS